MLSAEKYQNGKLYLILTVFLVSLRQSALQITSVDDFDFFLQELLHLTARDACWNYIYFGVKTRLHLILACILNYYEVSVRAFLSERKAALASLNIDVMPQRVSKADASSLGGIKLQRTATVSLKGDRVQRREASGGRAQTAAGPLYIRPMLQRGMICTCCERGHVLSVKNFLVLLQNILNDNRIMNNSENVY